MQNQEDHLGNLSHLIEQAEKEVVAYIEAPERKRLARAEGCLEDVGEYVRLYGDHIDPTVKGDLERYLRDMRSIGIWVEAARSSPERENYKTKVDAIREIVTQRFPEIRRILQGD